MIQSCIHRWFALEWYHVYVRSSSSSYFENQMVNNVVFREKRFLKFWSVPKNVNGYSFWVGNTFYRILETIWGPKNPPLEFFGSALLFPEDLKHFQRRAPHLILFSCFEFDHYFSKTQRRQFFGTVSLSRNFAKNRPSVISAFKLSCSIREAYLNHLTRAQLITVPVYTVLFGLKKI